MGTRQADNMGGIVNLASVDLNLLEPLIALLEERSVTRAAIRTQRSQPAVSASLALSASDRLRFTACSSTCSCSSRLRSVMSLPTPR